MGRGVLTLELAQGRLPSSSAIDHPTDIEHSSIQENHTDDDQNCVISENNIKIVTYQKITSCKSGWNCCKKIRRWGIRNADALKTKTSLMTEDQGLVFINFDSTIPMAMMETPETWVHSVVWKYLLCVAVLFTFLLTAVLHVRFRFCSSAIY